MIVVGNMIAVDWNQFSMKLLFLGLNIHENDANSDNMRNFAVLNDVFATFWKNNERESVV